MSFQTPGGPAAKRRRIEIANATLRKPFRSPLVNRQQTEPGTESAPSPSVNRNSSTAASFTPQTPATPAPARGGHRLTAASPLSTSPSLASASTPGLPPKRPASITSNPTKDPTTTTTPNPPTPKPPSTSTSTLPLLTQIQHTQTTLTTTLRTTQARLDLARQAQRIEQAAHAKRPGEPVDAELCALAARWKATSRLAAEELFGLVRGRVDGMGGARAWRGTRGWVRRGGGGWDDDGGDGGRGGEGEEGGSGDGGGEGEDGDGDGGGGEEREEEEEEESGESEFTMMMMLKSLNIEPEVLGYDPVEDKWLD
ncbi:hypothetical protein F5144DRAFT_637654 [Chaetomium tenue]|uniref:Uncharacterized protein n=1 Tax=Chaetomium tenue TaxID=1854479 RepID=A0ACB7PN17_9PEZI|nr:hypothetical protein F5144DRAFT_637654 [Chaetomium globosum]